MFRDRDEKREKYWQVMYLGNGYVRTHYIELLYDMFEYSHNKTKINNARRNNVLFNYFPYIQYK